MKEMSFISGIVIALGMSLVVKVSYPLVALFSGGSAAAQLVIAGCAVSYVWILTALSPKRRGQLVCALLVPVVECGLLLIPMQPLAFFFASLVLVWLARVVLLARGTLDALVDGSLVGVATFGMAWVLMATGSPGLLTWSFFLVLAARPLIRMPRTPRSASEGCAHRHAQAERAFDRSHAAAQRALTRLAQ